MNTDKYTLEELEDLLKDNPKLPQEARTVIEKAIADKKKGDKKEPVKPKAKATTKKTTTKKASAKPKVSAEQKAEKQKKLADATGKSLDECKEILAKYEALRGKTTAKDKERLDKLDEEGKLIEGTTTKTAEATTESTAKSVPAKIKKEVSAIEKEAKEEATKEVKTTGKTKAEVNKEIKEKTEEKIEKKVEGMTSDLADAGAKFIKSVQSEIAKFSKDDAKKFLLDIKAQVELLLKAYGHGGEIVETYAIPWSGGGRPMPTYAKGGNIAFKPKYIVYNNRTNRIYFRTENEELAKLKQKEIQEIETDKILIDKIGGQGYYAKGGKTKTMKKYARGGSVETPKIYVADLEAYNNGQLKGDWLDLTDYSSGEEVLEAIEEMLGEDKEWAIHDYENLPDGMYSEYMGIKDFDKIIGVYEASDDLGIPADVVLQFMSDFGIDDYEKVGYAFVGEYSDEEDFAYQLVEEGAYIPSTNEVYVSETDRRVIAGDEESNFRSNAEYEGELSEEEIDEKADEIYDMWYEGLSDPIYFLSDEMGMYSEEEALKQPWVQVDYERVAESLSYDYSYVTGEDGQLYVFNNNSFKRGGRIKGGKRSKHSIMQDRRRVSSEPWEKAYQKRKARGKFAKGGEISYSAPSSEERNKRRKERQIILFKQQLLEMNTGKRKTIDIHFVQGNYGQGWEDLTAHETRTDAFEEKKVYDENENYPHRVITKRVRKQDYESGNY